MSDVTPIYPPGPPVVPPDLTVPSPAYRRYAALAFLGVLGFAVAYLAFAGWLTYIAVRLLRAALAPAEVRWGLLAAAAPVTFLALFVIKAMVFVKRGNTDGQLEVTAAQEPALFAFLYRLADEARAPRPHRVFLSHEVNAGVFHDLSLLNFFLPSKKNLMIGLGVVNVLTLSELKAMLAHEFGHFTQRTMAIGRWVYVARQVAMQLVRRRDAFDRFLTEFSSWDLRIAWVGWGMRLFVWSIRSVADSLFRVVVIADRALSREMERHADLVAVSLAGSDAPVHGLHRLGAADSAMDRAMAYFHEEAGAGRATEDLMAVQRLVLDRMRAILDDPLFGEVPPLPENPQAHRLFRERLAHPPKMWATHPPNVEREEISKARYVPAPLDDRSAWILFSDRDRLCARVTAELYVEGHTLKATPLADSLARIDEQLSKPYLDPRYRGVYLGRSAFRAAPTVRELYDTALDARDARALVDGLYPVAQREHVAKRRELGEELALLEALAAGELEAAGGVIRHRGQEHQRRALPALIAQTKGELTAVEAKLTEHDRRCRTAHVLAARALGGEWEPTLRGLAALSHYVTHRELALDFAIGELQRAVSIALVDGRVSQRERDIVQSLAVHVWHLANEIWTDSASVEIGAGVAARLAYTSWREELGPPLTFEPANEQLGDWLDVGQAWCIVLSQKLADLRNATLSELLQAEQLVAEALRDGTPPPAPPAPSPGVQATAPWVSPASDRPSDQRLSWWDRFVIAQGYVASTVRLAVTGSIVALLIWVAMAIDRSADQVEPSFDSVQVAHTVTVEIYNGLDHEVLAIVGGRSAKLATGQWRTFGFTPHRTIAATAFDEHNQLIEREIAIVGQGKRYVYNIAGAAPFFEWTAGEPGALAQVTGARWFELGDRALLRRGTPAATEGRVLTAVDPLQAAELVSALAPRDLRAIAEAHAQWDRPGSPLALRWLRALAAHSPTEASAMVTARLAKSADEPALRRLALELAPDRAAACAEVVAQARAERDADASLLAERCAPLSMEQVLAEAARWSDHAGWARRAGEALARAARWGEARPWLERANTDDPDGALAVELARVRRAQTPEAELDDLLATSASLRKLVGDSRPPAIGAATRALDAGRLQDALAAAAAEGTSAAVLPLVAASDGAPPGLVATALAERPSTLPSLGAQLGLAIRERRDAAPFVERLLALAGDDAAALRRFVAALVRRKVPPAQSLDGASPLARGVAYSAARIALGDGCPAAWQRLALALLLPAERPYRR